MRDVKSPPNHVHPEEYIGRQLFSKGHFRKQGWKRVLPGAFLHQRRRSLSADRPDYGEPAFLASVSKQNAESRGPNRSFGVWARLTAEAASGTDSGYHGSRRASLVTPAGQPSVPSDMAMTIWRTSSRESRPAADRSQPLCPPDVAVTASQPLSRNRRPSVRSRGTGLSRCCRVDGVGLTSTLYRRLCARMSAS